jgi:hypothetical protein
MVISRLSNVASNEDFKMNSDVNVYTIEEQVTGGIWITRLTYYNGPEALFALSKLGSQNGTYRIKGRVV